MKKLFFAVCVILLFVISAGVFADADYLDAATSLADTRNYWRQPEGRNYLAAYGDNADAALAFVEAYLPNVWAGIAVFGDLSIGVEDIKNEAGIELPVWLFAAEMTAVQKAEETPGWELLRDRKYGKTRICIWRRTA